MRFHKVLILLVVLMLLATFAAGCGEMAEEMDPEGTVTEGADAEEPETGDLNDNDLNTGQDAVNTGLGNEDPETELNAEGPDIEEATEPDLLEGD